MKVTDRVVLAGVAAALLLAAFYFMVLAPKREKASTLSEEVTQLEASLQQAEQTAAFGQQARQEFPEYYGRLVVLGKAVPEQADSSSLLVQVNQISERAGVGFRTLQLVTGSSAGAPAPTAAPGTVTPAPGAPATGGSPQDGATPPSTNESAPPAAGVAAASSTTTPALATEAAAASLPIGATVGPAGLPTMPYELLFRGQFFQVADFIKGVDQLVHLRQSGLNVAADGRLLTIDGFSLEGDQTEGFPLLEANFAVTSYVTPAEQGLTAGAVPGAPGAAPSTVPTTGTTAP